MLKTDKFWSYDFSILMKEDRVVEFFPTPDMTTEEKLNSITRFSIYLGIFLSMIRKKPVYLLVGLCGMFLTYFIFKNSEKKIELKKIEEEEEEKSKCLYPTAKNPFANPVITDFGTKKAMKSVCDSGDPEVQKKMNDYYDINLYKDANDVFNNQNSQRQFYTLPENDQDKFGKWLFGNNEICKDSNNCIEEDLRRNPFNTSFPDISQAERTTSQNLYLNTSVKKSY